MRTSGTWAMAYRTYQAFGAASTPPPPAIPAVGGDEEKMAVASAITEAGTGSQRALRALSRASSGSAGTGAGGLRGRDRTSLRAATLPA